MSRLDFVSLSLEAAGHEVTPELWARTWLASHESSQEVNMDAAPAEFREEAEAQLVKWRNA